MVSKIQKTERNFVMKCKTTTSGLIKQMPDMEVTKKTIYEDQFIKLEKIEFGKYKRPPVFREMTKSESGNITSVTELKTLPDWYLRSKKLNSLLNEED